ncbi:hypothetical protein [Shimia thalassica]|uniref:hypothetical protein n=1 Tax=Shimia thalassica TaxID=1715693 RepID=UPI0026E2195D|nr:hypothetical protein [Shimia thalassica]MDO6800061.1 hypothetical protein [Shimia thalassica]
MRHIISLVQHFLGTAELLLPGTHWFGHLAGRLFQSVSDPFVPVYAFRKTVRAMRCGAG